MSIKDIAAKFGAAYDPHPEPGNPKGPIVQVDGIYDEDAIKASIPGQVQK